MSRDVFPSGVYATVMLWCDMGIIYDTITRALPCKITDKKREGMLANATQHCPASHVRTCKSFEKIL